MQLLLSLRSSRPSLLAWPHLPTHAFVMGPPPYLYKKFVGPAVLIDATKPTQATNSRDKVPLGGGREGGGCQLIGARAGGAKQRHIYPFPFTLSHLYSSLGRRAVGAKRAWQGKVCQFG